MSLKDFKTDRSQDPGATESFEELLRLLSVGPRVEAEYRAGQEEAGNPYIKIGMEGRPYADIITPISWSDKDISGPPDTVNLYHGWDISLGEQYWHEQAHMEQSADMSNMEKFQWKMRQGSERQEFGDNEIYGWSILEEDGKKYIQQPYGVDVLKWPISGYDEETSWSDYFYGDDIDIGQWGYPITEDGVKKWKIFKEGDIATIEADATRHRTPARIKSIREAYKKDLLSSEQTDYKLFDKAPQEKLINPKSREDVRENAMWMLGIDLPPVKERGEGLNNKLNESMNVIDMISIGAHE